MTIEYSCEISFCIEKATRPVSQYKINKTWFIRVPVIGSFLIKTFQFMYQKIYQDISHILEL